MRDLQRDWMRWTPVERIVATALAVLPLIALPTLFALRLH